MGDIVFVGNPLLVVNDDAKNDGKNDGHVSVFSTTSGKLLEKITPPKDNSTVGSRFGTSLAASEKFLVVGSPNGVDGRQPGDSSGAVYVYEKIGDIWSLSWHRVLVGNPTTEFGSSVGVHGNTIVVGATNADVSTSGLVYVFAFDEATWSEQQRLEPSEANDVIGGSVVIGNRHIAIRGRKFVYIFTRNYLGVWGEETKLSPPYLSNRENSMAIYGSRLLIGANLGGEGKVYVFSRLKGVWVLESTLRPSNSLLGDGFGCCVAMDAQMIVIGSCGSSSTNQNAVYVFEMIGEKWTQVEMFTDHQRNQGIHAFSFISNTSLKMTYSET